MASACAAQLSAASTCVQGDPASCACFSQPFDVQFPGEVLAAFRSTLAFEIPGSEFFCDTANDNVCMQVEVGGSCCCQDEVLEYISCSFTSDFGPQFGAPGCEFSKCGMGGGGGGEGGGSSMMMIVVILLLLCCCGGGFFYYRRRNSGDDDESTEEKEVRQRHPTVRMRFCQ